MSILLMTYIALSGWVLNVSLRWLLDDVKTRGRPKRDVALTAMNAIWNGFAFIASLAAFWILDVRLTLTSAIVAVVALAVAVYVTPITAPTSRKAVL